MTPKGIPTPPTTPAIAPAAQLTELPDAILEPLTASDAIKHLIQVLGHDVDEVAAIEVRRNGVVRILEKDRGLRTHRVEWPVKVLEEEEA